MIVAGSSHCAPLVQEQWASAVSACRRVSQVRRQISSALMVLKNVSTAAFCAFE